MFSLAIPLFMVFWHVAPTGLRAGACHKVLTKLSGRSPARVMVMVLDVRSSKATNLVTGQFVTSRQFLETETSQVGNKINV